MNHRYLRLLTVCICCLIGFAYPISASASEVPDDSPQANPALSQEQTVSEEVGDESADADLVSEGFVDAGGEDEGSDSSSSLTSKDGLTTEAAGDDSAEQRREGDVAQELDKSYEPISAVEETTVVTMTPADNLAMVVDIAAGSKSNEASARLYPANSTAAQRFRIEPIEHSEYSYLFNVNSDKVLDVKGASAVAGAVVQQYAWNKSDAQRWIVSSSADGIYCLYSALKTAGGSMLVLGYNASSGSLELHEYSEGSNLWILNDTRSVEDGVYSIASGVAGNKVVDIKGASLAPSVNAQTYESNGTNAQRFSVTYDARSGYYTIASVASGMVLDVTGASRKSGANVQQYRPNGSAAQQWSIEPEGDGFVIVSRASGMALDVWGGSAKDGANVQQYKRNGTLAQHWALSKTSAVADGCYLIQPFAATGFGLDAKGGKTDVGTNIQLYRLNGTAAQSFEIVEYRSGLYTIRHLGSGLFLGLEGGLTTLGTNVELEAGFPLTDSKLWTIKPGASGATFVSATGLALDVKSRKFESGTNVQGYISNGTASQLFVFKALRAEGLGITDVCAVVTNQDDSAEQKVLSSRVGGETYLFLPSYVDETDVCFGYLSPKEGGLAEIAASKNGAFLIHDQLEPIDFTVGLDVDEVGGHLIWIRPSGSTIANPVHVLTSANIRALFITSDDPVKEGRYWVESSPTHNNKTTGSMLLVTEGGEVIYDGGLTQIKGRGNGTWLYDKKPYQIKLSKKASLIDGSKENKSKTWVLLGNLLDASLVRDYITKQLALALGIDDTPECEFVDLYYDGEYRGTYQLSEKVQIDDGRIEIYDLEKENENLNDDTSDHPIAQDTNEFGFVFQYVTDMIDPDDVSGGYLIEMDNGYYRRERSWFETSAGFFVVKSPEDASYGEVKYISELFQRAINEAQRADGNIAAFFDVESLVKLTLLNELSKNPDYLRWSSTYFYKDKGENSLIVAGPAWDFDLSLGCCRPNGGMVPMAPEGLISDVYGFFTSNEQYCALREELFETELLPAVIDMLDRDSGSSASIYGVSNQLAASWIMNHIIWDGYHYSIAPAHFDSQDDAVGQLWNWTAARINWLACHLMGSESQAVELGGPKNGTYTLISEIDTALDVAGGSMLANANVQTWTSNGTGAQLFHLLRAGTADTGEGYYAIFNAKSGLALDACEKSGSNANNVCQNRYNGSDTQLWVLRQVSSDAAGRYQIVSLNTGLALTMASESPGNGVNVQLAMINGRKTQYWHPCAA